MFEKLGIDTMKVLEAAKAKYNFQVHYPGAGVGGPCLPINSYQLLNTARRTGMKLSIIESGRIINEAMPDHVIRLTLNAFNQCKKSIEKSKILIMGISYKANVKDVQLSPAKEIIKKFQNLGSLVHIYDPFFHSTEVFGLQVENTFENILPEMDAVVIVTDHDEFKKIEIDSFLKIKSKILIDSRGIIDPISVKNKDLIFRGLGRGNF
jgi:nucleotide sugar dehydrogenase